jgi:hypothetical protein
MIALERPSNNCKLQNRPFLKVGAPTSTNSRLAVIKVRPFLPFADCIMIANKLGLLKKKVRS